MVVEVWRVRLHGAWWRRFTKEGRGHWRGEREARVRDKVWEWGMLWKQQQGARVCGAVEKVEEAGEVITGVGRGV